MKNLNQVVSHVVSNQAIFAESDSAICVLNRANFALQGAPPPPPLLKRYKFQGVSAVLRTLLGGILLLGANIALAQISVTASVGSTSTSRPLNAVQIGDTLTASGRLTSTFRAANITTMNGFYRCVATLGSPGPTFTPANFTPYCDLIGSETTTTDAVSATYVVTESDLTADRRTLHFVNRYTLGSGENYFSAASTRAIPALPPSAPLAPTFVSANIDANGVPLTWSKPTGANGFKVYAGTSSNFTADDTSLVKTLDLDADGDGADCIDSDNDCAYTVPHANLSAGSNNHFRIIATGSGGDSTASVASAPWASPSVLTAPPTSGLTASFVAGSMTGNWQAPTGTGGLGTLTYAFTGTPLWLDANNSNLTLTVNGTVPAVGTSVPNITYTIGDRGMRDTAVIAQITIQITAAGPLTLSQPECTTSQTHAVGATVGECGLGSAGGGSGGAKTYTLSKTDGNAADLAALGLEVVAGGSVLTDDSTGSDPLNYTSTNSNAMNIRSIDGETTKEGNITLRYRVTEPSSGASSAEYTFTISVGDNDAPAADSGSSSSGGIVALALIGAGAYFWWKKRQIQNGNAAKMALLPDVTFDLDRNDRRAFYTQFNWQNPSHSNWQLRGNAKIHTKYSGKLLDWHANSHIGYRLNGKLGEFNPYYKAKFVQNDPENAEMDETYTLGLNYALPNRFSVQFLQPDDEIWRYSLKTEMHLPRKIVLKFNQQNSDIWRYSANLNWQISERIGLSLTQPNNDLPNYGFGIQWRNNSKIRYGISGETGNNSYRFTGSYAF